MQPLCKIVSNYEVKILRSKGGLANLKIGTQT